MGTAITELLAPVPLKLSDLAGKVLAVDAYNQLYMFLATIRGPDGALLQDRQGHPTSHLSGLFFRFARLLEAGVKCVFVFDGAAPALKAAEQKRRAAHKRDAEQLYAAAQKVQDVAAMRKYAARTAMLTAEMLANARALIAAMGMPAVDAPAEGEAEAAALVRSGRCYAVLSQDADALLFGAPRVVKNLSIAGRRKVAGRPVTQAVPPELIELEATLTRLGLSQRQLIALGLLVGTDFNPGGIKGLGPKKSLALVRKYGEEFEQLFAAVNWGAAFDFPWRAAFDLFVDMPVHAEVALRFGPPKPAAIERLLVLEHDFAPDRVADVLARLGPAQQKGLSEFFEPGA